jgi:hypothetical protein
MSKIANYTGSGNRADINKAAQIGRYAHSPTREFRSGLIGRLSVYSKSQLLNEAGS